jgi:hypothetical protein
MAEDASNLACRLARDPEAVCRHYLSNGRREGRYWMVGDVRNTPGRSMLVRLSGPESGPGAVGHWTDAQSSEFGDLLDVIRESCGLIAFKDVADEARRFLSLPRPEPPRRTRSMRALSPSPSAAQRLFAASRSTSGTLAEIYLRSRGITLGADAAALRFHPRCFYRSDADAPGETHPAMIARITDLHGEFTGVHRTWLHRAPSGGGARSVIGRRALGRLLGHGVRFGKAADVLIAGEGIETTLSLRAALPAMPLIAALSAAHLGALCFPPCLRRLYVARDADAAGDRAFARLRERASAAGIELVGLSPRCDDFNTDLVDFGAGHLRCLLRAQLMAADAARFLAG